MQEEKNSGDERETFNLSRKNLPNLKTSKEELLKELD